MRRQPVSVTATLICADAVRWQSRATFVSDDDGQVDITRQAPVSGTYEGVAPMGLFWSMGLVPGEARPVPPGAIMLPVPIRLEAEGTDGRRAEIMIVRRVAGPGVTRHVIRTDGIVGTLFLPPGSGPHPAVMVVLEISYAEWTPDGLLRHVVYLAERETGRGRCLRRSGF
jgi:acyl-CoA thioester hydrolase/bile acid acetyltransferase-like protein